VDTILVTGAGGKTGRAVVAALAARGAAVRALVRHPEDIAALRQRGAHEVVAGDMLVEADVRQAAEGAGAVYHICPNVHPGEVAIGLAAIAAARASGVEHFVFHSVLHPQAQAMPHHWNKLLVEEAIFTSGLPFTILQPAPYMQNVLASWATIREMGVYTVPYPVETRLSLVDLEDVAESAAIVLTESGHTGAIYELAGTPPLTQSEVAAGLGAGLGRPVNAVSERVPAWEHRVRAAGMGEAQISTLNKMFDYYARFGLPGNPNVLGGLLRRPPASLATFAARAAQANPA
jgi:NAD(P)H dehydrogenase (quinone)